MSDTARMKRTPFKGTPLKGMAGVTLLVALALAACGNDSKGSADVKRGTMPAVYADINRVTKSSFKVTYDAQGAGLKRVTSYWKGGKARVDTVSTTRTTRHYASGGGSLIECVQNGSAFQCEEDTPAQGFSFRQNLGPDYQRQVAVAREAGTKPSTRKILGQVVDCWSFDATEAVVESQTCVNENGAVLYYTGGSRDDPYQEIAVAYTTDVSDAEVTAPPAPTRKHGFLPVAPSTTTSPTGTTAPPSP
jgi:hypothetical protein